MAVYLDWNATTVLRPEAEEAWLTAQRQAWANPASSHRPGQQARARADEARRELARLLSAKPHEFIFTGSGTESINLALHTALLATAGQRRRVLASAIDHSAVIRGAQRIDDLDLGLLPVDSCGRLDCDAMEAALRAQPCALVCLQWANNELGTLHDLAEIIPLIRQADPETLILVDACQGIGKAPCDLHAWGADLVAGSAHKFGGPRVLVYVHALGFVLRVKSMVVVSKMTAVLARKMSPAHVP